ncbi:RICIN domain-containing protein [Catenovulum adriaticum]|uniref:RICIN domain-containing protein n=1 Tax=Catenovulum adriaticum TaxID=2984846 RepID=A0ABY7AQE5_9ALTE|nr:RICIN domain-containing protein [Catenovulum sp. TS8]WAJ71773.1 RICIN domain-containing protein [Catenovulum sp. TS8]
MKRIMGFLAILLFAQAQAAEVLFEDETSFYPRMVRLAHNGAANNTIIASFDVISAGYIYKSTDDGQSWSKIATINENGFANTCCSELYEMPVNMGSTTAGTLFWAVSAHNGTPPASREIKIYKSTDQGQSWSYLSSPVSGATGLWEAEFIIDDYGRLVMYYASEEHKGNGYNQLIAHKISTDGGVTWGSEVIDVAMNDTIQRPGMPTITQLPNGDYVMVYEICGSTYNCDTFYKKSSDGLNWGTVSHPGTRIESVSGHHFSHAPTITWIDNGTANGELVVGAQVLRDSANNDVYKQHSVYMVNSSNGDGLWAERAAPLFVPSDGTNPCNSYSPQFLPRLNGNEIIHMTNKECRMYSDIGAFNMPVSEGAYRLVAKHSGKALDVNGCSTASAANVQQWPWTGGECQRWDLEYLGNGDYKITSINSGQALEVNACSTSNGGNVQQYPWNDADCQKWKIEPVGGDYFRLVNKNSGLVLDVDACSSSDGQNVQQWQWLAGDCQQWKLEPVSPNAINSGEYSITSKNSNKVLDVAGCGTTAGDNVQQWPWSGANCQRWILDATSDGFYQIISKHSNMALDVDGCLAVNGQNVQQWTTANADCQKWGFEEVESGFYKIFSKNGGKVLDVNACSTADGANVQTWQWLGGDCQRWSLSAF